MSHLKIIPWMISLVLTGLLVFVYVTKNAEIEGLNNRYQALVADSNKKLEDAAQQKRQIADEAAKKQQQLAEEATKRQQQLAQQAESEKNAIQQETSRRLAEASLPEATVIVTFRKAFAGQGQVAKIANIGRTDAFSVKVQRPSTGQLQNYDMVLNGGTFREIGHREGWAFVSGDVIETTQPGHKNKSASVP